MARIPLSNGFTLIPEGTYVFKIVKVTYDETFGKMEISMVTPEGLRHTERYSLLDANGEINEGALNAFSYFAKTALNNYTISDIDEQDLVGKFIRAEVVHNTQTSRKTGKQMTFANLGDKSPATAADFGETPEEAEEEPEVSNPLLNLLGKKK
jgi:hypothetical protein